MNDLVVIVKELTVQVSTGASTEDSYGQGFSAIYAEAVVSDGSDVERLLDAEARRIPVTLRCAMLDAIGTVTKAKRRMKSTKFVVAVEGITYRKPTHAWERVEYRLRGPT